MRSLLASAPILCVAVLLGLPARADIPPPETEPCQSKAVGAACVYNGNGTCQTQTCSKPDYAHWDHDASSSPPTATYDCVMCVVGTPTDTGTATNTTTSTNTGGSDSSCSIARQGAAKHIAPWLLAGGFSLLFLFGRRRRPR